MELATRIFDIVTDPSNVTEEVRNLLPEIVDDYKRVYRRKALRIAALCHDVGHLPFPHAAEKDLLPVGTKHEHLTRAVVLHDELGSILDGLKLQRLDVVRLRSAPRKLPTFRSLHGRRSLPKSSSAMPSAQTAWTTRFVILTMLVSPMVDSITFA